MSDKSSDPGGLTVNSVIFNALEIHHQPYKHLILMNLWLYEPFSAGILVPETGIEPVRPLSGKRRILSPLCLPISPLGLSEDEILAWRYMASREFDEC
jgi:hypothetical protein